MTFTAAGLVVMVLTEALKKIPQIPFEGKTKAGLLLALTVLYVLCRVGIAVLTNTLPALDVAGLVAEVSNAAQAMLVAMGGYSGLKLLFEKK